MGPGVIAKLEICIEPAGQQADPSRIHGAGGIEQLILVDEADGGDSILSGRRENSAGDGVALSRGQGQHRDHRQIIQGNDHLAGWGV